ncbi:MAG TPA: carboxyl transferase domain-containing protein [Thermoanaerobaculia bacterium]|nr:carboxyl transferase domain-containing protein [Thermoanaerobaculia bacterium]
MKLMIANRGEVAIRIARAAAELEIETVAIFAEDDAECLHVRRADAAVPLSGSGPRAYLDAEQIVGLAAQEGCVALHPGWGFLAESAELARRCAESGILFVGPPPEVLELFGDKTRARALAERQGVPVPPGISEPVTLERARAFFEALPAGAAMVIKAAGGGGGRGLRVVGDRSELADAYRRAASEAEAAFGAGDLYVEELVRGARHVEVQIAGDDEGNVSALGDRDCSLQRRHQKLIEIAPAPALPVGLRRELVEAALALARAAGYRSLGTFEFLVPAEGIAAGASDAGFSFLEANARLQVEHTVTEEVTGLDLVRLQLELARGRSLDELGCSNGDVPAPRGFAVQARVNLETLEADGATRPSSGTLTLFEPPTGPGVRTDTYGYAGYRTSSRYDSLLAKVIGHSGQGRLEPAMRRTARALEELRIAGVETNVPLLLAILEHPDVGAARIHTRFVDEHLSTLVASAERRRRSTTQSQAPSVVSAVSAAARRAGARVDALDPLAVLDYGKGLGASAPAALAELAAEAAPALDDPEIPDGAVALRAPMQGTVVGVELERGETVRVGAAVLIMEAMKMEHEIRAPVSGTLGELFVAVGDTVYDGTLLAWIEEATEDAETGQTSQEVDLDEIRPDLAEVHERHAVTLDAARPDAVAKRRRTHQRTARENVDDLCDEGTFVEHGQLVLTPGTGLPREQVIARFPTDGMITGIGNVNGGLFPGEDSRCVVMAYDYTVLAGTQGALNHPKTDRMLELAEQWRRPVVLFAEGGGGRAGTGGRRQGGESTTRAGQGRTDETYRPLDTATFSSMARLSGLVPLVGITSRFCFAGNASLLGCCDVIIATADSSIGMGGPALIEGGGLGVFRPEEVGPMAVQVPNGVVDVAVADEAEGVRVAKKYLSYFQGRLAHWDCADQRLLRRVVPENRLRVYRVRDAIEGLADLGSVLELRSGFGPGIVTALIRIEGRPLGVVANDPEHLSGAIDSPGSDKAARFLQLCDAFDLPVLVLCDTPGMMVGPEIERSAIVRHCSRLFVTGANLTVPILAVVLRKAYGLGAQAMCGGDLKRPFFTVAWPTAEFGGMGLEGQVKLGFRNELAAIEDPEQRRARYQELVAAAYERGRALSAGASFAVDDVIDPAETRRWIARALESVPAPPRRAGKKRPYVDTW